MYYLQPNDGSTKYQLVTVLNPGRHHSLRHSNPHYLYILSNRQILIDHSSLQHSSYGRIHLSSAACLQSFQSIHAFPTPITTASTSDFLLLGSSAKYPPIVQPSSRPCNIRLLRICHSFCSRQSSAVDWQFTVIITLSKTCIPIYTAISSSSCAPSECVTKQFTSQTLYLIRGLQFKFAASLKISEHNVFLRGVSTTQ